MTRTAKARWCARCGKQPRTENGYCRACNAQRMAEARGKLPLPETGDLKQVRVVVDRAFDLLDAAPGTSVTVGGVTLESDEGGSVTFKLTDIQIQELKEV